MLLKEIKIILGGDVSTKNTKMPGTSFGLSTDLCNVGSALREIECSVCSACYARRIEAFRPSVKKGWMNRTLAVQEAMKTLESRNLWVDAMVERLTKLNPTHHRWHDSGDLQGEWHLYMLIRVAEKLPNIKFWLPTKERAIVKKCNKELASMPPNLCIRESAAMVGDRLDTDKPNSMVIDKKDAVEYTGWICPAPHQGNACGDCRACWDTDVLTVAYIKH